MSKIIKTGAINYPFLEEFDIKLRGKIKTIKFLHSHYTKSESECQFNKGMIDFISRIDRFIPKESTVIDFGASSGDTTIPLSLLANRTLAFEPGPNFEQLTINSLINSLNIEYFNFAATDKDGLDIFNYSNHNGGHNYKTSYIGDFPDRRIVKTVNIQKLLNNLNIENLSFIKIDTEGYDVKILNMIINQIQKHRPIIHIEWFPDTTEELANFITTNNYFCIDFQKWTFWNILPQEWTQDLMLIPREFDK